MQTTLQPVHRIRLAVPLLDLINPREQTRAIIGLLVAGILAGAAAMYWWKLPLWGATAGILAILLIPAIAKWRADYRRYGATATGLCVLVAAQGFHGVEHAAQWVEYHILRWPFWSASGLISAADAEWVHFVWNWTVLLMVAWLIRGGMRNPWAWMLLLWAIAHTFEHTYLMVRFMMVLQELNALGATTIAPQGLPGILGRDGWLATSELTQNSFLCRLPGLTTAVRLDVHFWWNVGETILLLLAGNTYMRGRTR